MLVRPWNWLLLTVVGLTICSCGLLHRNRQPKIPPPIATVEVATPEPVPEEPAKAPEEAPAVLPSPPHIEAAGPAVGPPMPETAPAPLPPPPRSGAKRSRSLPATAPPKQPATPEETETPPAAVPALTQILSKQEQWEYNREIDERLLRVNETVNLLTDRRLARTQMEMLDRIRAFVRQTIETRKADLVTARSLARRAELLARDLERTSR